MLEAKTFISRRESIATEHPLASLAGLEVLQKGGNAFDAAVAASFALGVVQPHLSGLGGDFFALFYSSSDREVHCINSSGWSPLAFNIDTMKSAGHNGMPAFGPLSAVVPGYLDGIFAMHEKFGRTEFPKLLTMAVDLAENGFPVGKGLAKAIAAIGGRFSQSAKDVFMPLGRPPRAGESLRQPLLGEAIREVALRGPEGLYRGRVAAGICTSISEGGLAAEAADLADFRSEWCEPISSEYGDSRVYEVPPNSMGATTLLMLKLLEDKGLRRVKPDSWERVSLTLDAAREAYRRRDAELGDGRFVKFDLQEFLRGGGARGRHRSLTPIHRADTTNFAVSDSEGNLLSCIQSVFHHFGSRVYVKDGGFFLNNRGSAFKYTGPNRLEPRKRPLHTLSSLLVERGGGPSVAVGCSGGDFRPQQHALFLTNLIDYSMSLEEAVGFPRFLWEGGNRLMIERGYRGLPRIRMKKTILEYPGGTGVAQGVERLPGCMKAVCDLRGEGIPFGT